VNTKYKMKNNTEQGTRLRKPSSGAARISNVEQRNEEPGPTEN
jgi:hypothetical protein